MGQYEDDLLNGFCCQECGQFIDGEEPGHPRTCNECDPVNGVKLKNLLEEECWIEFNNSR